MLVIGGAVMLFNQYQQASFNSQVKNEVLAQPLAKQKAVRDRLVKPAVAMRPALRLPAPQVRMTNASASDLSATNTLYSRLENGRMHLTREQVEAYLSAKGRTAANLLMAFRASGDAALLKEAMEKFPNNPEVAFAAIFAKGLSVEQQRLWLTTLAAKDPNNGLVDYVSALNYFSAGQIDEGVQALLAADGKPLNLFAQKNEEIYLSTGCSLAEAKIKSIHQADMSYLVSFRQLSTDMIDLANAYRQIGDMNSAQAALELTVSLGQRFSYGGGYMISQLVGMSIERNALQAMDPANPFGNNSQTVQDALNQLAQEKAELNKIVRQSGELFPRLSEQDWITYIEIWRTSGEVNACRWVIARYGQP